MKFLAIDTSGKHLSVVAYADGVTVQDFVPDCAMKHSVVLMDKIGDVCVRANMSPRECDFFAVVVGPGSFTGIRIGISTVKGLCLACDKPALSVTSFDCIAYSKGSEPLLALVDAGHGYRYACGYDGEKNVTVPPAYQSPEQVDALICTGYRPVAIEEIDPCEGLLSAVLAKKDGLVPPSELLAVYLRKSSAEENRK